jgi:hypothetical protein
MGGKAEEEEYETDTGGESEYETDEEQDAKALPKKGSAPAPAAPAAPAAAAKGGKEAAPCGSYRVDTTGGAFGACKCGWPKVDHEAKKGNKAEEALSRLKSGKYDVPGLVKADKQDSSDACLNFRVDVNAAKFGTCKCGRPQADHKAAGVNPADKALQSLKSKASSKQLGEEATTGASGGGACANFRVDVTAAKFGTCKCGHLQADHKAKEEDAAAAMLRKLKEKNASKNEIADALAGGGGGHAAAAAGAPHKGDDKAPAIEDKTSKASKEATTAPSTPAGCCVVQ